MDIKVIATGSKGNCYTVTAGNSTLIIEAGISFKDIQIALNFKLSKIAGVLITHEHADHAKAVPQLVKRGMNVYMSQGTAEALQLQSKDYKKMSSMQAVEIGEFTVKPFKVEHDAREPFGFLIYHKNSGKKLLFVTDTYYIRYKFRGLTHVMIECNYALEILAQHVAQGSVNRTLASRILESHMSLENVCEFFNANIESNRNIEQVYLIHASNTNGDAVLFKDSVQRITGAEVYI